jgi:hypothetical protein
MTAQKNKMRLWLKRLLIIGGILLVAGVIAIWYIFSASFSDTAAVKADYEVSARSLIKEFQQNDSLSNRKYAEKIILVRGVVTDIEQADTTVNIKMADTTSGAYIIFAFQQQHLTEAKKIKTGDSVAIKGSCSGGAYSQILETEYISFKRSTLTR